MRVTHACFDNQDRDVRVLGETPSHRVAGRAAADDDEVEVRPVPGHIARQATAVSFCDFLFRNELVECWIDKPALIEVGMDAKDTCQISPVLYPFVPRRSPSSFLAHIITDQLPPALMLIHAMQWIQSQRTVLLPYDTSGVEAHWRDTLPDQAMLPRTEL